MQGGVHLNNGRNKAYSKTAAAICSLRITLTTVGLLMLFMGSAYASATPSKPVVNDERQHLLSHGHRMILIDAGHGGSTEELPTGTFLKRILH